MAVHISVVKNFTSTKNLVNSNSQATVADNKDSITGVFVNLVVVIYMVSYTQIAMNLVLIS